MTESSANSEPLSGLKSNVSGPESHISGLKSDVSGLTRIVKMHFASGHIETFIALFNENRERIAAFPGCEGVNLHRDLADPDIFFTISRWRSEDDLENYRRSELFASVWKRTRVLFQGKAEAWSVGMC